MGKILEDASESVVKMMDGLIAKHYPDLQEAEVKISIFMATKRGKDGEVLEEPAIRVRGIPALAKVKINGPDDRAEGKGDATITIDGPRWDKADKANNQAILDHELYHLEIRRNQEDQTVLRDAYGRPLLKMRPHDHEFGWFDAIADRHKDASGEVRQAKAWFDKAGQGWFQYLPYTDHPTEEKKPTAGEALKKIVDPAPGTIFLATITGRISMNVPEEALDVATLKIACWITGEKYNDVARTRKFIESATAEQVEPWMAALAEKPVEAMLQVLKSSAEAA